MVIASKQIQVFMLIFQGNIKIEWRAVSFWYLYGFIGDSVVEMKKAL